MLKLLDFFKAHPFAQYIGIFILGVAIGALFYPSKRIEEKTKATYEQQISQIKDAHSKELQKTQQEYQSQIDSLKQKKVETEQKLVELNQQVVQLKTHQKSSYYKIVHPDGTIEIKRSAESDTDESQKVIQQVQQEFTQKLDEQQKTLTTVYEKRVSDLQKQFDSKEQDYQKQIQTLETSKVIEINKRNYDLEIGALTDQDIYLHASTALFGPFFIGVHSQIGPSPAIGAGLGLRF
jgi:hypothetical protein